MHTPILLLLTLLLPFISCAALPANCTSLPYPVSNHTIPLTPALKEYESAGLFGAQVFVGNQLFTLAVDTGSSDTWLLAEDVNCTRVGTLQPVPPAECGYSGPRYSPGTSYDKVSDMHLNASYLGTESIVGPLGYTELILGGLTVPKQKVSAVTYASVGGVVEGNLSGIIGLAYPSLANAFPGTDPSKDIKCKGNSSCGPIPYSTFISTLFKDGLTPSVFSVALSRSNRSGGVWTIGGVPRLDDAFVNATEATIASSPIKPILSSSVPDFYSTEVDSFVYSNSAPKNAGQIPYILDTGTMYNLLPAEEAKAINALFDPPAILNETLGIYEVSCDAKPPELGISIGGQVFYHNPKDMIIHYLGQCFSAVKASPPTAATGLLGATWLKNVLAIFDVGASKMTFVSRVYYEDS